MEGRSRTKVRAPCDRPDAGIATELFVLLVYGRAALDYFQWLCTLTPEHVELRINSKSGEYGWTWNHERVEMTAVKPIAMLALERVLASVA